MAAPDQTREPCPDRILDDIGGAFGMGAVGGSAFHFIKGVKNSPKGERFLGGTQAVRMNAPRVGGSFAVWGGLFSTFDCSAVYIRQKEDPWNSIFAGAATGGFLQMRHGTRAATRSAIFGGVLLALIEGAGLMINRMLASVPQPPPPPLEQPMGLPAGLPYAGIPAGQGLPSLNANANATTQTPTATEESGWKSWMGGFFSSKNDDVSTPAASFETSSSSFPSPTLAPSFDTGKVPTSSESSSDGATGWKSWMGGFFGKKKEDVSTTPSAPTGETLGSYETTSGPAIPTFDYK